jgi:hypothetical protein
MRSKYLILHYSRDNSLEGAVVVPCVPSVPLTLALKKPVSGDEHLGKPWLALGIYRYKNTYSFNIF